MKKIKIDLKKFDSKLLDPIAESFRNGKIIAYPTDTIYGLGCRADNTESIDKIRLMKQRDKSKSFILLVRNYCMLKDYFEVNQRQEGYLRKAWVRDTRPGFENKFNPEEKIRPVTVILKAKNTLSKKLISVDGSVAVRLPRNEFLIKIIKRIGVPIVSTSLNISGEPNLETLDELEKKFRILPDLVVDAGRLKGKASRIVDIRDMDDVKIIRK